MKRISRILSVFLCVTLVLSGVTLISQPKANAIAAANYQQSSEPWGSVPFNGYSFASSACGIMSMVNAVNIVTGNWIDPVELATWANVRGYYTGTDGTDRDALYPALARSEYPAAYGFTMPNTGTYDSVYNSTLKNHLLSGGVAVAHVYGHFLVLRSYDAASDSFLVWDNAADIGRRGTTVGGDWRSAYELRYGGPVVGGIARLRIDWWCLIASAGPVNKSSVARDSIKIDGADVATACSDTTNISIIGKEGKRITMSGWFGSTQEIGQFGYKTDNNGILYHDSFKVAADSAVVSHVHSTLGSSANASRYSISFTLEDDCAHKIYIYVKDGGQDKLIWTINASGYTDMCSRDDVLLNGRSLKGTTGTGSEIWADTTNGLNGTLRLFGWYANTSGIDEFAYSIDGGAKITDPSYAITPEQAVIDTAKASLGSSAVGKRFSIEVPVDDQSHDIVVYAKSLGKYYAFWTVHTVSDYQFHTSKDGIVVNHVDVTSQIDKDNTVVDVSDAAGTNLGIWGWFASNVEIDAFGYKIDDREVVFNSDFMYDAEDAIFAAAATVIDSNSIDAARYAIDIPMDGAAHMVDVYMKSGERENVIWSITCESTMSSVEGDADGNKILNVDDATYLFKNVMHGSSLYPIYASGDYNSDGQVDVADSIYLIKHLMDVAFYPLYPSEG